MGCQLNRNFAIDMVKIEYSQYGTFQLKFWYKLEFIYEKVIIIIRTDPTMKKISKYRYI